MPSGLFCAGVSKPKQTCVLIEGTCAGPSVCPLTKVKPGAMVCIKQLLATPDVTNRLRELGLGEEQRIKLLSSRANYICQVCNARLGISEKLAESIMVELLPAKATAA
jgi:Fe2+ transport system protein FeoA